MRTGLGSQISVSTVPLRVCRDREHLDGRHGSKNPSSITTTIAKTQVFAVSTLKFTC